MIVTKKYDHDFLGNEYPCTITQFYGKDCIDCTDDELLNDLIREVLFRKCITSKGEHGIVIGFEINEVWMDDYFIVFVPGSNEIVCYENANYAPFYKKVDELNEIMCDERLTWEFDSDIGIHSL